MKDFKRYFKINEDGSVEHTYDFEESWKSKKKFGKVADDFVEDVHISTVFLALNHAYSPDGEPMLFETMVFGETKYDEFQWRYPTYEEALKGHEIAKLKVEDELIHGVEE